MKEIKCSVIQDLLPLYIDDAISDDTKTLVNKHLKTCEECKKEYEQMKETLYVPIENKATLFIQLNKQWNKKKRLLIFSSVLATILLGFAVFSFIVYYAKPIPYATDLVKIEEKADGTLVSNYFGKSHAGTYASHPIKVEIDGEMKNVSLIYYVETIANSPTSNLLGEHKSSSPIQFVLPESESVDAVYYGSFDFEDVITTEELEWEKRIQQMTLVWER
ncbi:zf-HC2 domain-containing protein [Sporosarcina sp. PTS2304]|uniref:zf-HC2 domain-containing protein n=1 Tax=Sporosarcina sp. PTS2304 TaxID=2283194 RepID=UPI000E0D317A|nr:zf-HC2 domain-containing protein [Sporosarcina sp. PTS2304]AXI00647.1 zf-HC2 domain-containing protein [Sporosarcina sp. PTS2304]